MYFGKWAELYEVYKRHHNFIVARKMYKEEQVKNNSLLEL